MDINQELKRLKNLAVLTEPERSPDYNQKIKLDEASSVQIISETLLDALRRGNLETVPPVTKTIDQQIPLGNQDELPNKPEGVLSDIAKYFRRKRYNLRKRIEASGFIKNQKQ